MKIFVNGTLAEGSNFAYSGGKQVQIVICPHPSGTAYFATEGEEKELDLTKANCFLAKGPFTLTRVTPTAEPKMEDDKPTRKPLAKSKNGPAEVPTGGFSGVVCQTQASRQLSATFSNMMRYFHKANKEFCWEVGEETVFKLL